MENLLDQETSATRQSHKWFKLISLFLIILNVVLITNLLITALTQIQSIDNPLLPRYTAFYVAGNSINWACFMIVGIILGVLFRIFKKYAVSAVCMAVLLIAGFILKDQLTLFKYFILL